MKTQVGFPAVEESIKLKYIGMQHSGQSNA